MTTGAVKAPIETVVKRFAKAHRKRLRKLARISSRLGDLIRAFPAAAAAIVTNRGPAEARNEAVRLVRDGAPLATVAAALDLPLWLRRLPPEAFDAPMGPLPSSPEFARRVVNAIPEDPEAAAMWLEWVGAALEVEDEAFALWLAGQRIYAPRWNRGTAAGEAGPVELLAAFAWHSGRALEPGGRAIERPWRPGGRFRPAATETEAWLFRLLNACAPKHAQTDSGWFRATTVSGLQIVPLTTRGDLIREGERMDNCIATYWEATRQGRCLLYAVREGGRSVANLEIQAERSAPAGVRIAQLMGPSNGTPEPEVRRAVRKWLAQRRGAPMALGCATMVELVWRIDASRWSTLWRPYVEARDDRLRAFGRALFRGAPRVDALDALGRSLGAMARLARADGA